MANIGYFIFGAAILVLFIFISRPLMMIVPGFGLKLIALIALGVGCVFVFMWLFPECTSAGNRQAIETDLGSLYEGVVDIGKGVIDPEVDNYRFNKWLNNQRKNRESGYYQGINTLQYYNAEQDKDYYQLPDGRWQESGLWNTPVDLPFTIPPWQSIKSTSVLRGTWTGTSSIKVPADNNSGIPEFTAIFSVTMECQRNTANIGLKFNIENMLDAALETYSEIGLDKDQLWSNLTNGSKSNLSLGKYYYQLKLNGFPLEAFSQDQSVLINSVGTKMKIFFPGSIFDISGLDSMECILHKL